MPSRIVQRHFAKLVTVVSESPGVIANELFSKKLISQDVVDKTQLPSLTAYDKASAVVSAVQARIDASGRDKELKILCKVMAKHENMKKLSTRIMENFRKLKYVVHLVLYMLSI